MPKRQKGFKPSNVTKTKFPNPGAWLTNAGKSLGVAAFDVITKDMFPATADIASSAVDLVKTMQEDFKDLKSQQSKIDSAMNLSFYKDLINTSVKNTIDDVKSGKLYHSAEEVVAENDDFDFGGFDDDSFDFDDSFEDDFDADFESEGGQTKVRTTRKKGKNVEINDIDVHVDIGDDSAFMKASENETRVAVEMNEMTLDALKKSTNIVTTNMYKNNGMLSSILGSIDSNVSSITTAVGTIAQGTAVAEKYYSDSMGVFNNILEAITAIKNVTVGNPVEDAIKQSEYKDALDMFSGSGFLDLNEYKTLVTKQLNSALRSNMFTSPIIGVLEDKDSLKNILSHPVNFLVEKVVHQIIPEAVREAGKSLDDTLSKFATTGLFQLGTYSNDIDANPILKTLGSIFGIRNKMDASVDKANYKRGKVDWDGESRKTLIEVIPFYLRKIAAGVTGQREVGFDYEKGVFRTIKDMVDDYTEGDKRYLLREHNSTIGDLTSYITSQYKLTNDKQKKEIKKVAEGFFTKLIRSPQRMEKRMDDSGNYTFAKSIANVMGTDKDDNLVKVMASFFDNMKSSEVMEIFGENILSAQANMHKRKRQEESGEFLTNGMYVDNTLGNIKSHDTFIDNDTGTISSGARAKSLFIDVDKYGQTPVKYLKDILELLLDGIRVYPQFDNTIVDKNATTTTATAGNKNAKKKSGKKSRKLRRQQARNITLNNQQSNQADVQSDTEETQTTAQSIPSNEPSSWNILKEELARRKREYTQAQDKIADAKRGKDATKEQRAKAEAEGKIVFDLLGLTDITQSQANAQAIEFFKKKADEDDKENGEGTSSLFASLVGSNSTIEKITNKFAEYLQKPTTILTDLFGKADQFLFNIIFGGKSGPGGSVFKQAIDFVRIQFKTFSNWLDQTILTPIHDTLFGDNGIFKQIGDSIFGQKVSSFWGSDSVEGAKAKGGEIDKTGLYVLNKGEYVIPSGDKDGAKKEKAFMDNLLKGGFNYSMLKGYMAEGGEAGKDEEPASEAEKKAFFSKVKSFIRKSDKREKNDDSKSETEKKSLFSRLKSVIDKKFGKEDIQPNGNVIVVDIVSDTIEIDAETAESDTKATEKGPITRALDTIAETIVARGKSLIDTILGPEDSDSQARQILKSLKTDLSGNGGKLGAGSAIGAVAGVFTPLGPIGGALIGLGTAVTKESETIKQFLFGKRNLDTNERMGGVISKQVIDTFKENKTGIKIGSFAGLMSSIGFFPAFLAPGGPIGGALIGGAVSMAWNLDSVQRFIYGYDDTEGNHHNGFVDRMKAAFGDDYKKLGIDAGIGAGVGVIGGFFIPGGGPIIGALLGAAAGITLQTEKVKNFIFGEKDERGIRSGGLISRITDIITGPVRKTFAMTQVKLIGWLERAITTPLSIAMAPIIEEGRRVVDKIKEGISNVFNSVKHQIHTFIIKPFTDAIKTIFDPLVNATKTIAKGALKVIGTVIASPFKLLEGIGYGLNKKHMKEDRRKRFDSTIGNALTFNRKKRAKMGLDDTATFGERAKSLGKFFTTHLSGDARGTDYSEVFNGKKLTQKEAARLKRKESEAWEKHQLEILKRDPSHKFTKEDREQFDNERGLYSGLWKRSTKAKSGDKTTIQSETTDINANTVNINSKDLAKLSEELQDLTKVNKLYKEYIEKAKASGVDSFVSKTDFIKNLYDSGVDIANKNGGKLNTAEELAGDIKNALSREDRENLTKLGQKRADEATDLAYTMDMRAQLREFKRANPNAKTSDFYNEYKSKHKKTYDTYELKDSDITKKNRKEAKKLAKEVSKNVEGAKAKGGEINKTGLYVLNKGEYVIPSGDKDASKKEKSFMDTLLKGGFTANMLKGYMAEGGEAGEDEEPVSDDEKKSFFSELKSFINKSDEEDNETQAKKSQDDELAETSKKGSFLTKLALAKEEAKNKAQQVWQENVLAKIESFKNAAIAQYNKWDNIFGVKGKIALAILAASPLIAKIADFVSNLLGGEDAGSAITEAFNDFKSWMSDNVWGPDTLIGRISEHIQKGLDSVGGITGVVDNFKSATNDLVHIFAGEDGTFFTRLRDFIFPTDENGENQYTGRSDAIVNASISTMAHKVPKAFKNMSYKVTDAIKDAKSFEESVAKGNPDYRKYNLINKFDDTTNMVKGAIKTGNEKIFGKFNQEKATRTIDDLYAQYQAGTLTDKKGKVVTDFEDYMRRNKLSFSASVKDGGIKATVNNIKNKAKNKAIGTKNKLFGSVADPAKLQELTNKAIEDATEYIDAEVLDDYGNVVSTSTARIAPPPLDDDTLNQLRKEAGHSDGLFSDTRLVKNTRKMISGAKSGANAVKTGITKTKDYTKLGLEKANDAIRGTKGGSKIMGLVDNALSVVGKLADKIITKFKGKASIFKSSFNSLTKSITKMFSGGGKAIASKFSKLLVKVGAASTGIFFAWGVVSGSAKSTAANLFGIDEDEVDTKMRAISTIWSTLQNIPCGIGTVAAVIEVISEIAAELLGFNFVREVSTFIYGAISGDEDQNELLANQDKFIAEYETAMNAIDYSDYTKTMTAQGLSDKILSEDEWTTMKENGSSLEAFNDKKHKTLGAKVADKMGGVVEAGKKVATKAKAVYKDVRNTHATDIFTKDYWAVSQENEDGTLKTESELFKEKASKILGMPLTIIKGVLNSAIETIEAPFKILGSTIKEFGANTKTAIDLSTGALAVFSQAYWTPPTTDDKSDAGNLSQIAFYINRLLMAVPSVVIGIGRNISAGIGGIVDKAKIAITAIKDNGMSISNIKGLSDVFGGNYWIPPMNDEGNPLTPMSRAFFYGSKLLMLIPSVIVGLAKDVGKLLEPVITPIKNFAAPYVEKIMGNFSSDGGDEPVPEEGMNRVIYYIAKILGFVPKVFTTVGKIAGNIITPIAEGIKIIGTSVFTSTEMLMHDGVGKVFTKEFWTYNAQMSNGPEELNGIGKILFYAGRILSFPIYSTLRFGRYVFGAVQGIFTVFSKVIPDLINNVKGSVDNGPGYVFTKDYWNYTGDDKLSGIDKILVYGTKVISFIPMAVLGLGSTVIKNLEPIFNGFKSVGSNILSGVTNAVKSGVTTVFTKEYWSINLPDGPLKPIGTAISFIGKIVTFIPSLVVGLGSSIFKNIEPITESFKTMGTVVSENVTNTIKWLKGGDVLGTSMPSLDSGAAGELGTFGSVLAGITRAITVPISLIIGIGQKVGESLSPIFDGFKQIGSNILNGIISGVKTGAKAVFTAAYWVVSADGPLAPLVKIVSYISKAMTFVPTLIVGIGSSIFDNMKSIFDGFKQIGSNILNGIVATAKNGAQTVFTAAYWAVSADGPLAPLVKTISYIAKIGTFIPNLIVGLGKNIFDGLKTYIDGFKQVGSNLLGGIKMTAQNGAQTVFTAAYWAVSADGPLAPLVKVTSFIQRLLMFVPNLIVGLGKNIFDGFKTYIDGLKQVGTNLLGGIKTTAQNGVTTVFTSEYWTVNAEGPIAPIVKVASFAQRILMFVPNLIIGLGSSIFQNIGTIIDGFKQVGTSVMGGMSMALQNGVTTVFTPEYWTVEAEGPAAPIVKIASFVGRIMTFIPNLVIGLVGTVFDGLKIYMDGLMQVGSTILSGMADAAQNGSKTVFTAEYWTVEAEGPVAPVIKVASFAAKIMTFIPTLIIGIVSDTVKSISTMVDNFKLGLAQVVNSVKTLNEIDASSTTWAVYFNSESTDSTTSVSPGLFLVSKLLYSPVFLVKKIFNSISNVFKSISDTFKSAFDTVENIVGETTKLSTSTSWGDYFNKSKSNAVANKTGIAGTISSITFYVIRGLYAIPFFIKKITEPVADLIENSIKFVKNLFGLSDEDIGGEGSGGNGLPRRKVSSRPLLGGNGEVDIQNGFPYYSQNDPNVRNKSYRVSMGTSEYEETMGSRGCGPTAMAMVASRIKGGNGNPYTPENMARLAESGNYSTNDGTMPGYFTNVGQSLGMNVTPTYATPNNINLMLESGQPVIIQGASTNANSPYTAGGHYVVAVGKDNRGDILINDPRGRQYSKAYRMDQVVDGSARAWGFSDGGYGSPLNVTGGFGSKFRKLMNRVKGGNDGEPTWISIVKAVKKLIADKRLGYSQSRWTDITLNGRTIKTRTDCSGFVIACLIYYGVLDKNRTDGNTSSLSSNGTDGKKILASGKFKKVPWNGWDSLQAGDIMIRGGSHVQIFAYKQNGRYYVWSNGSSNGNNSEVPTSCGTSKTYPDVYRCLEVANTQTIDFNAPSNVTSVNTTSSNVVAASSNSGGQTSLSSMFSSLATAMTQPITEILYGKSSSTDNTMSTNNSNNSGVIVNGNTAKGVKNIIDSVNKYETNGGPDFIERDIGDGAGKNYGIGSFTQRWVMPDLARFIKNNYPELKIGEYTDIYPTNKSSVGTSAFDKSWKNAANIDKNKFWTAQAEYLMDNTYLNNMGKMKDYTGIDFNDGTHSEGVAAMILSLMNWGPAAAKKIFTKVKDKAGSDSEFIKAAGQAAVDGHFVKSKFQKGIDNRFNPNKPNSQTSDLVKLTNKFKYTKGSLRGGNGDVQYKKTPVNIPSTGNKVDTSRYMKAGNGISIPKQSDRARQTANTYETYNDINVINGINEVVSGLQLLLAEMKGTNQGINKFNDKEIVVRTQTPIINNTNVVNGGNGETRKSQKTPNRMKPSFIDQKSYNMARQIALAGMS